MPEPATQTEPTLEQLAEKLGALTTTLESERENRARLEGQVSALRSTPAPAAPAAPAKVWTRSELQTAVDAGTITDEQKEAYLERELLAKTERLVTSKVDERVTQSQTQAEIQAEIDEYKDAFPSIKDKSSEDFGRITTEYAKLVRRGMPSSIATELLAAQLAFGPVPKSTELAGARETDQAGAGGGSRGSDAKQGGALGDLKMPARNHAHYEKLMSAGQMTEAQVREEWTSYSRKSA